MKLHVMSADIKLSEPIKDSKKFIKNMEKMLQRLQQKSASQNTLLPIICKFRIF